MPRLFLFAAVFKPCVCCWAVAGYLCGNYFCLELCVCKSLSMLVFYAMQLLKAARILTGCARDKESMEKKTPACWLVLPPADRWAGRFVMWEYPFISSLGDAEAWCGCQELWLWCRLLVSPQGGPSTRGWARGEFCSCLAGWREWEQWTTIPQIAASRKATEIGTAAGRLQQSTETKCKVLCLWQTPYEKLD